MALRTNAGLVGGIVEVDPSIDPAPFMLLANEIVTQVCTASGYDAERLLQIETWLSAHFYCIRDPRAREESVSVLRSQYQSRVDLGFNVTHYGQQAMRIDTAGNLANLNNRVDKVNLPLPIEQGFINIGTIWLGKPNNCQKAQGV